MSLSRKKKQGAALLLPDRSAHIGKSFHGLRKICNVFFCLSVLYTVAHTVPDMPFQHDLSATMQRGFGGVELRGDILAGYVLIDHPVNGLHLSDDFFQSAVQIICVHTLPHSTCLLALWGSYFFHYSGFGLLVKRGFGRRKRHAAVFFVCFAESGPVSLNNLPKQRKP